ncbi:hypothetical protein ACMBCN_00755 [Candidatus Liberibacter asiaticus]
MCFLFSFFIFYFLFFNLAHHDNILCWNPAANIVAYYYFSLHLWVITVFFLLK